MLTIEFYTSVVTSSKKGKVNNR